MQSEFKWCCLLDCVSLNAKFQLLLVQQTAGLRVTDKCILLAVLSSHFALSSLGIRREFFWIPKSHNVYNLACEIVIER